MALNRKLLGLAAGGLALAMGARKGYQGIIPWDGRNPQTPGQLDGRILITDSA